MLIAVLVVPAISAALRYRTVPLPRRTRTDLPASLLLVWPCIGVYALAASESIQITQKMINAATRILWDSGRLYAVANGTDQIVVHQMLLAAFLAAPGLIVKQGPVCPRKEPAIG